MASQAKREDIERRITVCQEYARLWEEFFKCFGTGDLQQRKILDQDEVRFQKIVSELARQQFRFGFFMGDRFSDGDKIVDILERAENLRTIQAMPDANFSKLEVDWPQVFINMHRAVGRLMRELPPEELEEEEDGKGKKKKKKGEKTLPKATSRSMTQGAPGPAAPAPQVPAGPKLGAPSPGGPPRLGVPRPGTGPMPPRPKGP
jgi:hypothetical protein